MVLDEMHYLCLDGLTLLYVTDQLTRLALFKSGGGDVMAVTPKDATDLQKSGYTIISYPAGAFVLVPDSANATSPWANVKVRMAAEYAINKNVGALGYGFSLLYRGPPPASAIIPDLPKRT
jgi:ABC-type transport system substrate-binding protein